MKTYPQPEARSEMTPLKNIQRNRFPSLVHDTSFQRFG